MCSGLIEWHPQNWEEDSSFLGAALQMDSDEREESK